MNLEYLEKMNQRTLKRILIKINKMKVKDLIKELQQVENQDKYIHLLGNTTNGEDDDFDIIFNNIEVWDDGDESITLFMSVITELDENHIPIEINN
jgi:hypothetical protein